MSNKTVEFPATNYIIFEGIMRKEEVLCGFMNSIGLWEKIEPKQIVYSPPIEQKGVDIKNPAMDVRFQVENYKSNGKYLIVSFDLEMQNSKPGYDLMDRLVTYVAELLYEAQPKGPIYEHRPCVVVAVLDFTYYKDDDFIHIFKLNHKNISVDQISIITIELTKRDKCGINELGKWCDLLNAKNFDSFEGCEEAMSKAIEEIKRLNDDPVVRERARRERLGNLNLNTESYYKGKEEGFVEGKEEGHAEATKETAKKMKEDGLSLEMISKYTGLSLDEINNL